MSFKPYDPNAQNSDDNGFDPPADGKYGGVTLTDTWAGTSKNSGKDGALLTLQNTDGYEWKVWLGVDERDHEVRQQIAWQNIGSLGVDQMTIGSTDELHEALKQCRGNYYDVVVKTNGAFRNSEIQGLSTGSNPAAQERSAAAVGAGGAPPADDDIPF